MFVFEPILSNDLCLSNPDAIVVFGDNLAEKGTGPKSGQAVIRNQKNSFGIPTKRLPSMKDNAFFSDLEEEYNVVRDKLVYLWDQHELGKKIILPADGLGTGRALLFTKSPVIFKLVARFFNSAHLFNQCNVKINYSVLSSIAGFTVNDCEISIDCTQIHYGNAKLKRDGFINMVDYLEILNKGK